MWLLIFVHFCFKITGKIGQNSTRLDKMKTSLFHLFPFFLSFFDHFIRFSYEIIHFRRSDYLLLIDQTLIIYPNKCFSLLTNLCDPYRFLYKFETFMRFFNCLYNPFIFKMVSKITFEPFVTPFTQIPEFLQMFMLIK